jgi:hypothetical protein
VRPRLVEEAPVDVLEVLAEHDLGADAPVLGQAVRRVVDVERGDLGALALVDALEELERGLDVTCGADRGRSRVARVGEKKDAARALDPTNPAAAIWPILVSTTVWRPLIPESATFFATKNVSSIAAGPPSLTETAWSWARRCGRSASPPRSARSEITPSFTGHTRVSTLGAGDGFSSAPGASAKPKPCHWPVPVLSVFQSAQVW